VFLVDHEGLPANTPVSGTIVATHSVDKSRRTNAILNGDFTPVALPEIRFDHVTSGHQHKGLIDSVRSRVAVGGTIARAFAREGANLYLAGRSLSKLEVVASKLRETSRTVDVTELDALKEEQIEDHLSRVQSNAGAIDISFNAIGIEATKVAEKGMQGVPLTAISIESFMSPILTYATSHFLTGRAAARRMSSLGTGGVILMHTPEPARIGVPLLGGMAPAWAAVEALCRSFSAEFAAQGIRAVCLRTTGLPETETIKII
jgi:NAD(P)-dependent dehydrogenase (short-subunit alcohol dehydrogenase family)